MCQTEPLEGSSVSVPKAFSFLSSDQLVALIKSGSYTNLTSDNGGTPVFEIPVVVNAADGVSSRTLLLQLLSDSAYASFLTHSEAAVPLPDLLARGMSEEVSDWMAVGLTH